ncbi:MAG: GNAT family N-acetyltransferase [Verrucomicrobiota bacterium]
MRIRAARETDVEDLFDIRCSVIENHQSREELAELDITPETVAEMITGGEYISLLAEMNERPVGFTMARISEGYIFACFVRPADENQGVGRALMTETERKLFQNGKRDLWLSTGPGCELRAVGFYKRLGWKENGFLDDGQIRFEKTLEAEGFQKTQ